MDFQSLTTKITFKHLMKLNWNVFVSTYFIISFINDFNTKLFPNNKIHLKLSSSHSRMTPKRWRDALRVRKIRWRNLRNEFDIGSNFPRWVTIIACSWITISIWGVAVECRVSTRTCVYQCVHKLCTSSKESPRPRMGKNEDWEKFSHFFLQLSAQDALLFIYSFRRKLASETNDNSWP